MRRLRLMSREEQLLRETVRGLLREGDTGFEMPKPTASDIGLDLLGIGFDAAGLGANALPTLAGTTANILCDIGSVTLDLMQSLWSDTEFNQVSEKLRDPQVVARIARDPEFKALTGKVYEAYRRQKTIGNAIFYLAAVAAFVSIVDALKNLPAKLASTAAAPTGVGAIVAVAAETWATITSLATFTTVEGILKVIKLVLTFGLSGYQLMSFKGDFEEVSDSATGFLDATESVTSSASLKMTVQILELASRLGFNREKVIASLDLIKRQAAKIGYSGDLSGLSAPADLPTPDAVAKELRRFV